MDCQGTQVAIWLVQTVRLPPQARNLPPPPCAGSSAPLFSHAPCTNPLSLSYNLSPPPRLAYPPYSQGSSFQKEKSTHFLFHLPLLAIPLSVTNVLFLNLKCFIQTANSAHTDKGVKAIGFPRDWLLE